MPNRDPMGDRLMMTCSPISTILVCVRASLPYRYATRNKSAIEMVRPSIMNDLTPNDFDIPVALTIKPP